MLPLKIYKAILVMSERQTKKNTKWAKSCEEILTLNEALSFQRHCMHSSFVHYAHTSLRCPSSSHHIFLPHASSLLHLSLFSLLYSSVFLSSLSSTHKRKPQGSLSMERKSLGFFFFLLLILLASRKCLSHSAYLQGWS